MKERNQDITPKNLQQCADALMRLWSEYLFTRGEFDKISFDFLTTPPFKCDFSSWAIGKRVKIVDNSKAIWVEPSEPKEADYSYENFRKYLDMVHGYANTASLQNQMNKVLLDQLSVGDVFIMTADQIGNPYGHAAIIVDMAVHKETGEKIFIVAEGNMPATETYVVMNDNVLMGAWHKLNESGAFVKKEWVCSPQYFRRFE